MEMDTTLLDDHWVLTDVDGNPISSSIIGYYNFLFEKRMSYNTIMRFLIADLLKAKYDFTTELFNFNKYRFNQVQICGQILSVAPHKSNVVFTVDDGTAPIRVFGYEDSEDKIELATDLQDCSHEFNARAMLPIYNLEVMSNYNEVEKECRRLNKIADICRSMLEEANLTHSTRPSAKEIELGDILVFNGRLVQHGDRRIIFADGGFRITVDDLDFRENWFYICTQRNSNAIFNTRWECYDIPDDF